MSKDLRTRMEKANDELIKGLMRDMVDRIVLSESTLLAGYLESYNFVPNPYMEGCIKDTTERLRVLRWFRAMLRPCDPTTTNQWNMNDGTPQAAVCREICGNRPEQLADDCGNVGSGDRRDATAT